MAGIVGRVTYLPFLSFFLSLLSIVNLGSSSSPFGDVTNEAKDLFLESSPFSEAAAAFCLSLSRAHLAIQMS